MICLFDHLLTIRVAVAMTIRVDRPHPLEHWFDPPRDRPFG
jgi:hypothetical protein